MNADWDKLRRTTPARVGVSRSGTRPLTGTLLQLRADHAAAVDAVYGEVSEETLRGFGWFEARTLAAGDKELYLKRPDLGRLLHPDSAALIAERCRKGAQVQIVVSDGLSAASVEANVHAVYAALTEELRRRGMSMGTTFFVRGGRVGCMDAIGDLLGPDCVALLIGERPGLATSESLSAYMCYRPATGKTDADRIVVSNIHRGGTPPEEAGVRIADLAARMIARRASGVHVEL